MAEQLYYDLHLHSCLSPCGDNDMTPANIAGMAALKGLDVIALTDHNSCRNCPALLHAAADFELVALPGMEPVSYTHLDVYKRQVRGRFLSLSSFQHVRMVVNRRAVQKQHILPVEINKLLQDLGRYIAQIDQRHTLVILHQQRH